MLVDTSRFGPVEIEPDDIFLFSRGILGFEDHHHWILLADGHNDRVAWLQSLHEPEVGLALVSPRRFVPSYHVRLNRSQLTPLELAVLDEAFVLTTLSRHEGSITVNLRAPLLFNANRRIGRQVVTLDEQPTQLKLPEAAFPLRKSA
jgi:flagellar assembly factor FliW